MLPSGTHMRTHKHANSADKSGTLLDRLTQRSTSHAKHPNSAHKSGTGLDRLTHEAEELEPVDVDWLAETRCFELFNDLLLVEPIGGKDCA